MNLNSWQSWLLVGPLAVMLVACGAAAQGSKETVKGDVAQGPFGPAPPPPPPPPPTSSAAPLPPDTLTQDLKTDDKPKKPILERQPEDFSRGETDSDELEGGVVIGKLGDPLGTASSGGGGDGSGPKPRGSAVSAGAKGARHDPGKNDAEGGTAGEAGTQIGSASEVRGSLDKEDIRRVVMAHVAEVKRCYEQGLTRRPDLEGKVVLKLTIGRNGAMTAASVADSSLNERMVEQCMVSAALKWTFPKPRGDGAVTIVYPFIFKSGQ